MRNPGETFEEQFRKYAFKGDDDLYYIGIEDIRRCLGLDQKEYCWVDDLFVHSFGAKVKTWICFMLRCDPAVIVCANHTCYLFGQISHINFIDFIRFLDSGKTVCFFLHFYCK
jgi:hypothetical protein